MKITQVVCAIIHLTQGRILISRRKSDVAYGGLWEFPGGKVETGETFHQALRREIREELGITIEVGPLYHHRLYMTENNGLCELNYFDCDILSGEPQALDCDAFARPVRSALTKFQMMPVDSELARTMALEATLRDLQIHVEKSLQVLA